MQERVWIGRCAGEAADQGFTALDVFENLADERGILSAGENEGTLWPQAKRCPREAVARAGNHREFAAAFRTGLDVDKVN